MKRLEDITAEDRAAFEWHEVTTEAEMLTGERWYVPGLPVDPRSSDPSYVDVTPFGMNKREFIRNGERV